MTGLLLLIAAVVALCCYSFYFVSSSGEKSTGPPPPEKDISTSIPPTKPVPAIVDYSSVCRRTTQRIQQFCRNEGVPPDGFRVLEQRSIDRDGKRWLFTKAAVVFPRSVDPVYIATELAAALEGDGALSFTWKPQESGSCDLYISTNQIPTHLLTIKSKSASLAIIIDDVGNDLNILKELLGLGIPLTLSILPDLPYSKQAETIAHERGYEIMLHVPMEPRKSPSHSLGEKAIFHDMGKDEVVRLMSGWLKMFPHAKGVNNHMGSLVTEDEQIMTWVMEAIAPYGLYFIDSRTSSQSVAFRTARKQGIPTAMNYIFIDNEPEVSSCKNFIDKAIEHVKEEGTGIAIGHARKTTLQALREVMHRIQDDGIRLVFVSELLDGRDR